MKYLRQWLVRLSGQRPGRRGDVRGLLSLDDRMLADIGLRRAEVAAVASGHLPLDQLTVHGPTDARPRPAEPAAAPEPVEPERWDAAA